MITIERVTKEKYEILLDIWEESVRATHDFLTEKDIEGFKPLILEHAFPAVDLRCAIYDGEILGFLGVYDRKVEMLFLSPKHFGKGIGRLLMEYAIKNLAATKVDVNEHNPKAFEFYKHMGFEVVKRSPLDEQGNPFPILHMELKK